MPKNLLGKHKTVVMSGGAPQSPLMAGFLFALWEERKTFTKFHTSGAGALMALLFLSPSKRFDDPGEALQNWVEAGVSDEIYRVLPQNFKLFHKPGPFAPIFNRLAERYKVPIKGVPQREMSDPVAELMVDSIARLAGYKSRLDRSLRKDPIEQFRDALTALWLPATDPDLGKNLTKLPDPIRRLRQQWIMSLFPKEDDRRLYNDMVDLFFSALSPSTLTSRSLGMAAPLPFLEEIVEFDRAKLPANVRSIGEGAHLCVNAYNMTLDAKNRAARKHRDASGGDGDKTKNAEHGGGGRDRCQERKDDREKVMQFFYEPYPLKDRESPSPEEVATHQGYPITANGIRAAFSMPFIYPPAQIGDDFFSEGADHEPVNLRHVEEKDHPFVLLDVLGELEDQLVRKPRDLWDAFVISIMTPVVALANEDISDFKKKYEKDWCERMRVIEWDIPVEAQPFVMDWSRSNMNALFKVGREEGQKFLEKHGDDLDPHPWTKRDSKAN